jgi:hypothetical protein
MLFLHICNALATFPINSNFLTNKIIQVAYLSPLNCERALKGFQPD